MANRRRNGEREQFWRDVLSRFAAGGLSVREFCRQEQVGEPLFYAWRRTIAERDGRRPVKPRRAALPASEPAAPPPAFLPVGLARQAVALPTDLALELPGVGVLRFGDDVPVARAAALLRALATTACRELDSTEARP